MPWFELADSLFDQANLPAGPSPIDDGWRAEMCGHSYMVVWMPKSFNDSDASTFTMEPEVVGSVQSGTVLDNGAAGFQWVRFEARFPGGITPVIITRQN